MYKTLPMARSNSQTFVPCHFANTMLSKALSVTLFVATMLPIALSATIPGPTTDTIIIGEYHLRVATVPITPAAAANFPPVSAELSTSLTKRVTNNACNSGCSPVICTDDLSTSPDPPLDTDCASLRTALQLLAESELTDTFPCNFKNSDCPSFTIAPQFEKQYYVGTCMISFANLQPLGGANLSYCTYLMAGVINSLFSRCVVDAAANGGYCTNLPNSQVPYGLLLRHV